MKFIVESLTDEKAFNEFKKVFEDKYEKMKIKKHEILPPKMYRLLSSRNINSFLNMCEDMNTFGTGAWEIVGFCDEEEVFQAYGDYAIVLGKFEVEISCGFKFQVYFDLQLEEYDVNNKSYNYFCALDFSCIEI